MLLKIQVRVRDYLQEIAEVHFPDWDRNLEELNFPLIRILALNQYQYLIR